MRQGLADGGIAEASLPIGDTTLYMHRRRRLRVGRAVEVCMEATHVVKS